MDTQQQDANTSNVEVYDPATRSALYFGPCEASAAKASAATPSALRLKGYAQPFGRVISSSPELAAPYVGGKQVPDPYAAFATGSLTGDALRSAGFTGDECKGCGSFNVVRNGTCLLCTSCGSTSGCS